MAVEKVDREDVNFERNCLFCWASVENWWCDHQVSSVGDFAARLLVNSERAKC